MKGSNTDEQLMQLVGRGDREAFRELYERHARRLQGFFLRMLGYDADKAADFTQELFMKVYEQRRRFRPEEHHFSTWLYAMAYNLCKNDYRHTEVMERHHAEHLATADEAIPPPECDYDRHLLHQHLRLSIASLPAEQRTAFILRHQEELSVKEIARIMSVPEGTVKSRLHYALQSVAEKMKPFK